MTKYILSQICKLESKINRVNHEDEEIISIITELKEILEKEIKQQEILSNTCWCGCPVGDDGCCIPHQHTVHW